MIKKAKKTNKTSDESETKMMSFENEAAPRPVPKQKEAKFFANQQQHQQLLQRWQQQQQWQQQWQQWHQTNGDNNGNNNTNGLSSNLALLAVVAEADEENKRLYSLFQMSTANFTRLNRLPSYYIDLKSFQSRNRFLFRLFKGFYETVSLKLL